MWSNMLTFFVKNFWFFFFPVLGQMWGEGDQIDPKKTLAERDFFLRRLRT